MQMPPSLSLSVGSHASESPLPLSFLPFLTIVRSAEGETEREKGKGGKASERARANERDEIRSKGQAEQASEGGESLARRGVGE